MESPSALCRIIEDAGQPVGYAHAVDAGLWGEARPDVIPAGCWDLDIFIGAASHRGRGIAQRTIELLACEVFTTTLGRRLLHHHLGKERAGGARLRTSRLSLGQRVERPYITGHAGCCLRIGRAEVYRARTGSIRSMPVSRKPAITVMPSR